MAGPRVPNRVKKKICLTYVIFDLARMSGFGRLRRRLPWACAWRLLDRMEFGRNARSGAKLCFCCHHGQIHGEVRGENVMKAEIGGLAMVIESFASMRNWLGVSGIVAVVCKRERQHR